MPEVLFLNICVAKKKKLHCTLQKIKGSDIFFLNFVVCLFFILWTGVHWFLTFECWRRSVCKSTYCNLFSAKVEVIIIRDAVVSVWDQENGLMLGWGLFNHSNSFFSDQCSYSFPYKLITRKYSPSTEKDPIRFPSPRDSCWAAAVI